MRVPINQFCRQPVWEEKAWGKVLHVFASPFAAVSYLEILAKTRCSIHFHRVRANQFCVIEGKVLIEEFDDIPSNPVRQTLLVPGKSLVVPSRVVHRFRALQAGQMIEVYWADRKGAVTHDDIVRFDTGGEDTEPLTIREQWR